MDGWQDGRFANTQAVAAKHELQVIDGHFEKAAQFTPNQILDFVLFEIEH